MQKFTVTVTIEADTREQAERVIAERINSDYGFPYEIASGPVRSDHTDISTQPIGIIPIPMPLVTKTRPPMRSGFNGHKA